MPVPPLTPSPLTESLHLVDDPRTGMSGVIAIHSTRLGPAAGGCRVWHYARRAELVEDAVRLAKGMAYKNALAGLPFGGGKAVLSLPPEADRPAAFRAFGRVVASLGGAYVTAEDVGTSVSDMAAVRQETHHVAGLDPRPGRAGGDPSPWTALGVFLCIETALAHTSGSGLAGRTIAIQGLGHVGWALCRLLAQSGARLVVADVAPARVEAAVATFGAVPCDPERVHRVSADVFAPCALGAVLSPSSIPQLGAAIVCGAANNQLANDGDGEHLANRGVLYCPDYLVNAGGIVNVAAEYLGESEAEVDERVRRIPRRLEAVLNRSETDRVSPHVIADRMAEEAIAAGDRRRAA